MPEGTNRNARPSALILVGVALVIRLVIVQLPILIEGMGRLPKYIYVPVELALLFAALWLQRDVLSGFFFTRRHLGKWVILGFGLGAIWCVASGLLEGEWAAPFATSIAFFPVMILVSVLRSSLYEELLFRSLLLGYLVQRSGRPQMSNALQAMLFLLCHLRYFAAGDWFSVAFVGIDGLVWGWITLRTRSVIPVIIIHGMINAYSLIFVSPNELWSKLLTSWGV